MKLNKFKLEIYYYLIVLLSFSSISYSQTPVQKINQLNVLITQAETNGIDTQKEKMTVRTAEIYLEFADIDEANIDLNENFFGNRFPFPKAGTPNAPAIRPTPRQLAEDLPNIMRNQVSQLLDASITKLTNLLQPGAIKPQPVPVINWANINVSDNELLHNGKPVFLLDHSFKPSISNLTEYYGDLDGFFMTLSFLQMNGSNDIEIRAFPRNSLASKPTGSIGFAFLNQTGLPDFVNNGTTNPSSPYFGLKTEHPTFVKFDIDHPQARVINSALLSQMVPVMAGKNYTKLGYMISNEPHWFTAEGSFDIVEISDFTKTKFVQWLTNRHTNIATLNNVWGETNASIQAAVNAYPFPVPRSLRGTPKWYDWMRFNQFRITEWMTFLKNEIVSHDPEALIHIKLIPAHWSANALHDHGLDFEALTELSGIIGNDAGSVDSIIFGNIRNQHWVDRYGFNWRDSSMPFDFMTSVSPNKLVVNSEAHYISRLAFRDLFLKPNYARTAHWLAYLHGMDVAQSWVWFRNEDGFYQTRLLDRDPSTGEFTVFNPNKGISYPGSLAQQPAVLNEMTATVMDLNAHSEDISRMQNLKKPLRIFYSETDVLNDNEQMENIFDLYESLYFEGTPIGFATKNIIEKQPNSDWEAIMVYKTERVTDEEFNAVQNYLNNGGTVIIDNVSLKENEYGQNRSINLNSGSGRLIIASTVDNFKARALEVLEDRVKLPGLTVDEANSLGEKGVFWRTFDRGGAHMISLVNVGKEEATIDLGIRNSSDNLIVTNMLTGEIVSSNFVMGSETVQFLKVEADLTLSINEEELLKEQIEVYPNPIKDKLTIQLPSNFTGTKFEIYDLLGKSVGAFSSSETSELQYSFENYSSGIYMLKIINGQKSFIYKIVKQ